MKFDLNAAIRVEKANADLHKPDHPLAQFDLDPDNQNTYPQSPAYDVVVRQRGRAMARVRSGGSADPPTWSKHGDVDLDQFQAEFNGLAQVYLHLQTGAADVLVASMLAQASNGALAALHWRQVFGQALANSCPHHPNLEHP